MKTALHPRRLVLALGLLAAGSPGLLPPLRAQATQVPAVPEETADQAWADLKDDTYDMRAQFATGVGHLSARLDEQIRALRAKRAGMTKDLADWDFAMKEVDDARSDLTSLEARRGRGRQDEHDGHVLTLGPPGGPSGLAPERGGGLDSRRCGV
jgi:hypothetical protein